MLFQLPIDADISVFSGSLYVDELKRVNQTDLEMWMFQGNTEIDALKIQNAFTHSGLTGAMLLKWIANHGLALADVDDERYRPATDEIDRRISVMKSAHEDRLLNRDPLNRSLLPAGDMAPSTLAFDFHTEGDQWKMTVWDLGTGNQHTVNIHEY